MTGGTGASSIAGWSWGGAIHVLLGGITLAAVAATVTVGEQGSEVSQRPGGFAGNLEAARERGMIAAETRAREEPYGNRGAGSLPEILSMYLVASEQEASGLRRDLEEANVIRFAAGLSALPYEVVVSDLDVQGFARLYQLEVLRYWIIHEGLPPVVVVDIR